MCVIRKKKQKKLINKVNNKTVQRSVNIIQDARWQTIYSFNSGVVLLFGALYIEQCRIAWQLASSYASDEGFLKSAAKVKWWHCS